MSLSPPSEPDAADVLTRLSQALTEFVLSDELNLLDDEERGTMTRAAALAGEIRARRKE